MAKSAASLRKKKPVDNHPVAQAAKVALRQWALHAIGAPRAHVLDLYAGAGTMYRAAWHKAASYRGCDTRYFRDNRPAYVVDNQRLLRTLEFGPFNVFDLDAYGSPWKTATILAARRRLKEGETIAVVLTDGSMMTARLGGTETSMAALAGVPPKSPGAHRDWARLTRGALSEMARRMDGELVDMRASDQLGRCMYYCAALIRHRGRNADEKKAPAAGAAEASEGKS